MTSRAACRFVSTSGGGGGGGMALARSGISLVQRASDGASIGALCACVLLALRRLVFRGFVCVGSVEC